MSYQVIDSQTGAVVGSYQNKQAARNKRDRLDLVYGAVRYSVREMTETDATRNMLSTSNAKSQQRRFTGALPTGFGALL